MSNFVVAGTPCRDRGWILQRYLDALRANKPDAIFILTDNNSDDTLEILSRNADVRWENLWCDPQPGCTRDGSDGMPRYSSKFMAEIRNRWAAMVLEFFPEATHLFVCDSDVLPEPDVLEKLLALKAPVAAAFVPIADGVTPIHMDNFVYRVESDGSWSLRGKRTGVEATYTEPHQIWLCGGCYLIERRALDTGLRWGEHPQGEDGFIATECWRLKLMMMVDPGARCAHLMERDDEPT